MSDEINVASEKEVKDNFVKLRDARRQELQDIKDLLNTSCGMRFFKRLFEDGSIFSTTFKNNGWSAFHEGERNMALRYFNDICEAAPEKVALLIIRKAEDFKNGRN